MCSISITCKGEERVERKKDGMWIDGIDVDD